MQRDAAKFRCGQQRVEGDLLRLTDKGAVRFKHLGRATRFAFQGITGDVRGADVDFLQQGYVQIRLRFPDVQHGAEFLAGLKAFQQGGVIHHRATTGIN